MVRAGSLYLTVGRGAEAERTLAERLGMSPRSSLKRRGPSRKYQTIGRAPRALAPKLYTALQSMFDPSVPHGWHRYWKSVELPPLTDDAIDTLVEHASAQTSPKSYCIVFQLGAPSPAPERTRPRSASARPATT